MDSALNEWLNLIVRWIHVIFGIMWIGSSIFFNWLDSSFEPLKEEEEGVVGEVWMVHGGGFYHVKKKYLKPSQMPENLYWFKWEAGFTWVSGITLLSIVYYLNASSYMIDPEVYDLSPLASVGVGLGSILFSWLLYDVVWSSSLSKNPKVLGSISFGYIIAVAYVLTMVLSSRAAYMHVGAILGTIMAANVFMRILPGQAKMIDATKRGEKADLSAGLRAKMRSKHNNYMTYPVIFIMISNHFPNAYGHHLNWLILAVLVVTSVIIKHFLNISEHFKYWFPRAMVVGLIGCVALFFVTSIPDPKAVVAEEKASVNSAQKEEKVTFAQAKEVITNRCMQCHSIKPTDDVFKTAPVGVQFDTPERIKALSQRIKFRAVTSKTMPLANKTKITDEERVLLGKWIDQGANIE